MREELTINIWDCDLAEARNYVDGLRHPSSIALSDSDAMSLCFRMRHFELMVQFHEQWVWALTWPILFNAMPITSVFHFCSEIPPYRLTDESRPQGVFEPVEDIQRIGFKWFVDPDTGELREQSSFSLASIWFKRSEWAFFQTIHRSLFKVSSAQREQASLDERGPFATKATMMQTCEALDWPWVTPSRVRHSWKKGPANLEKIVQAGLKAYWLDARNGLTVANASYLEERGLEYCLFHRSDLAFWEEHHPQFPHVFALHSFLDKRWADIKVMVKVYLQWHTAPNSQNIYELRDRILERFPDLKDTDDEWDRERYLYEKLLKLIRDEFQWVTLLPGRKKGKKKKQRLLVE
jgi:hypothetical protein